MTILVAVAVLLVLVNVLAVRGWSPDTHAEVTQHGDYRF